MSEGPEKKESSAGARLKAAAGKARARAGAALAESRKALGAGGKALAESAARAGKKAGAAAAAAKRSAEGLAKRLAKPKRTAPHPESASRIATSPQGEVKEGRRRRSASPMGEAEIAPAISGEGRAAQRRGEWRRPVLVETLSVATSVVFAGAAGALFLLFVVLAPRLDGGADLWAVNRLPSIVILDRNGDEIAARGARYGQAVAVADLPPYLVKAILSTEDRRFYEHRGIDLKGTIRAFFVNLRSGEVVEGGSTITQQLARNLFLSMEQTYTRKIKEALVALWLEGRYTKDQILSLYLNRIYLGAGAYGVEQAAKTYFGKSAREVSLAEAVMLAGLPKAPSTLAPTQNPFGAQDRAHVVLDNLLETGAVTDFEAREARAHPPVIAAGGGESEIGYVFDYVAAEARKIAGNRPGDLIVATTIDPKMQKAAEAAVKDVIGVEAKLAGASQAALVAYDVSGALRAMVGGRSYVESQFNRATQAKRQPGSAFKPFVYVAALEAGLSPQSVFVDQPLDINGWRPTNYTEGHEGRMRLSEAVAKSVNTIAVQVTEYVGRDKVAEAAHRLGIRSDVPIVPSIALGGASLSLEELTGAYLPLANGGMGVAPYVIERIEDQNYEVIYQRRAAAPPRLIAPAISENMNHFLFQVMHSGTGAGASLGARVAVGKTGTTNDWRDAWFIGYTAQLTAGVWVGNDTFAPMEKVTGGTLPAQIWKRFMIAAHQDMPLRSIKGAYPAPSYGDEDALISFYTDVLRGLSDVRRDGDARRGRRFRDR